MSAAAPAGSDGESAIQILGDALSIIDLRDPLGHLGKHPAIIDFLEGLAVQVLACDLSDQQDHRSRVLHGDMQTATGVGGTGTAGYETDAGFTREFAFGLSHVSSTTLVAAHDQ